MIINYALNGVRKVPTFDHILIQPYARCVCDSANTWLSNDISAYSTCVSMNMDSTSISSTANINYQLRLYFKLYAIMSDGDTKDLIAFVADGHTVSCNLTYWWDTNVRGTQRIARIYSDSSTYSFLSNNATTTSTLSCPSSASSWTIKGYDNGTDVTETGAFLYILTGHNGGSLQNQTRATLNSFTVDGVVKPFTLSSDWGDR